MIDDLTDDMTDDMSNDKRQSRIRIWARRLGKCFSKCQPRRKCKESYLDAETIIPPPYRASITGSTSRRSLYVRRPKSSIEKPASTTSRVTSTASANWALPSQGRLQPAKRQNIRFERTIRLVNASVNSLVGASGLQNSRFPETSSSYAPRESDIEENPSHDTEIPDEGHSREPLPGPRSVLSWLDSFHTHQVFHRGSPRPPTLRNDSAADLTIRPGQTRPHPADGIYRRTSPSTESAASTRAKSNASVQICHPPSIHSHVALNAMLTENAKGLEADWEEPFQQRTSSAKGLWRSASQRLLVRNKTSLQRLDAESTEQDKTLDTTEAEGEWPLQKRSMEKIHELADEDQKVDEEWRGTWKAFDRAYGRL